MRADWFKVVLLLLNGETELARAVEVMMAKEKEFIF